VDRDNNVALAFVVVLDETVVQSAAAVVNAALNSGRDDWRRHPLAACSSSDKVRAALIIVFWMLFAITKPGCVRSSIMCFDQRVRMSFFVVDTSVGRIPLSVTTGQV
jgi:hypothetical protein